MTTSTLTLIGLAGRAGAGKDTTADILCSAYGFARTNFAAPLRRELMDAFCIDERVFSTDQKERRHNALALCRCRETAFVNRMLELGGINLTAPRSARELMRWWGTEYRRHQDDLYWIRKMAQWIETVFAQGITSIVITDVRFINEADFIRAAGGSIWKVRRTQADMKSANHQSEAEIELIWSDKAIDNNGSITDLASEIHGAIAARCTA